MRDHFIPLPLVESQHVPRLTEIRKEKINIRGDMVDHFGLSHI